MMTILFEHDAHDVSTRRGSANGFSISSSDYNSPVQGEWPQTCLAARDKELSSRTSCNTDHRLVVASDLESYSSCRASRAVSHSVLCP